MFYILPEDVGKKFKNIDYAKIILFLMVLLLFFLWIYREGGGKCWEILDNQSEHYGEEFYNSDLREEELNAEVKRLRQENYELYQRVGERMEEGDLETGVNK